MPEAQSAAAAKKVRPKRKSSGRKSGTITIEQVRSGICCNTRHKRILKSLGLRRPHQQVVRPDNPAVRGMVGAIPHLVRILEG